MTPWHRMCLFFPGGIDRPLPRFQYYTTYFGLTKLINCTNITQHPFIFELYSYRKKDKISTTYYGPWAQEEKL